MNSREKYAGGADSGNYTLSAQPSATATINLIEMVWVSAGKFTMGSPDTESGRDSREGPQHSVTLTKGFWMGKYPVVQEQYQMLTGTNPSNFTSNPQAGEFISRRPVECVSWYDAIVFCNKLSMIEGLSPAYRINGSTDPAAWGAVPTGSNAVWDAVAIVEGSTGYRLPTEAQWEYACRAIWSPPSATSIPYYVYNTGNTWTDDTGWYQGNSGAKTHQVGRKPSNEWGLYDMHGNVFEWCWDWYGNYSNSAQTDPMGPSSGDRRTRRGGCFGNSISSLRSANRGNNGFPFNRENFVGFRVIHP
jgi:formylglycine-generating enzyme required for sulfatase activity